VLSNDPNFEKSTLNDVQYQQIARNGGGHGQNGHKIHGGFVKQILGAQLGGGGQKAIIGHF